MNSIATQNIGIEYLSWINREMHKIAEVKQENHNDIKKAEVLKSRSYFVTALAIISPYLLASLSLISLDLLSHFGL